MIKFHFLSLKLIRTYQRLNPLKRLFLIDSGCRFQPTCSRYTYQAIKSYGIMRGSLMGVRRIFRCHPLSKGGWDPVK